MRTYPNQKDSMSTKILCFSEMTKLFAVMNTEIPEPLRKCEGLIKQIHEVLEEKRKALKGD